VRPRAKKAVRGCSRWAAVGAAITVGIAWGFAFHSISDPGLLCTRQVVPPEVDSTSGISPRLPPGAMGLCRFRGLGVLVLVGEAVAADIETLPGIPWFDSRGTLAGTPEENAPGWAQGDLFPWLHHRASWPRDSNFGRCWDRLEVDARGWPLPALYCVRGLPAGGKDDLRGGVVVSRARLVSNGAIPQMWPHPLTLPWFPVWGGLAVDSALYGLFSFGIWRSVTGFRRRWRKGEGQCARCGYPLLGLADGSVCPECGA
jgi:hypothetical protein